MECKYRTRRSRVDAAGAKKPRLTPVNPKHIESHVSDFEHLFALHKKTDYARTAKAIDELKRRPYVGADDVR